MRFDRNIIRFICIIYNWLPSKLRRGRPDPRRGEDLGWSDELKHALLTFLPFFIWWLVGITVVVLMIVGAIGQSYDYVALGTLGWFAVHSSVICGRRIIPAARTYLPLWSDASRTWRVCGCLVEAWDASSEEERCVVVHEIIFGALWLGIVLLLFT